jgi:prefoldin subunit 5
VPLNPKATFRGQLIHTNEVKVHLGGEWWVEMTADEAAAYVRRRRRGERVIIRNAERG